MFFGLPMWVVATTGGWAASKVLDKVMSPGKAIGEAMGPKAGAPGVPGGPPRQMTPLQAGPPARPVRRQGAVFDAHMDERTEHAIQRAIEHAHKEPTPQNVQMLRGFATSIDERCPGPWPHAWYPVGAYVLRTNATYLEAQQEAAARQQKHDAEAAALAAEAQAAQAAHEARLRAQAPRPAPVQAAAEIVEAAPEVLPRRVPPPLNGRSQTIEVIQTEAPVEVPVKPAS